MSGIEILGLVVLAVVLIAAITAGTIAAGNYVLETVRKEEYKRDCQQAAEAAYEAVCARMDELLALTPGMHIKYGDRAYTVGSHVVTASPGMLPRHRFELTDGSDAVKWLDIQVRSYGLNGVWITTQHDYSGPIPADRPRDLVFAGRSFSPGLWGTDDYYTASNYPARQAGTVKFFKYSPHDSRGEFGSLLPSSDSLLFERFDDGPWFVSLAKVVQATELVVLPE